MTTAIHTHHFDQLDDQTLNHRSAVLRQFQGEKAMNLDEFDGFCAALHCAAETTQSTMDLSSEITTRTDLSSRLTSGVDFTSNLTSGMGFTSGITIWEGFFHQQ